MRCTACGAELVPGKRFCHACGAKAPLGCVQCGAAVGADYRFCPDCGHPVGSASPAPGAIAPAPAKTIDGERKIVSVVFCDLAGSTAIAEGLDAEEYRDILRRYLEIALAEVYRLDGVVTQLAGDGFMTIFGAPIAREDAPERAVRAALAVRDRVVSYAVELRSAQGIDLRVRLGVHTGPVVVGTVGTELRLDYTAIGDTTNLASRLEALAPPDGILISEATERIVRGLFDLRPTGPLDVKGKRDPVSAFEVLGEVLEATPMARAAQRGLTPFVGRTKELDTLERVWRRLGPEGAQVVMVVGGAGSGKSRLVYELRQRLVDEAPTILEGRCASMTTSVPYAPFLAMFRGYFAVTSDDCDADACAKVGQKLGVDATMIHQEYPTLAHFLGCGGSVPSTVSGDQLKQETFTAVTRLVRARATRGPVLMVLEDLQWIDEASQELLNSLLATLDDTPALVVVTSRPRTAARWSPRVPVTTVVLEPLADADVRAIVHAAGGSTMTPALEAELVAKAGGSPFFAEELARGVAESGLHTGAIPDTIQEVVAARLDRLAGDVKRVVQVASVLGRQFSVEDLTVVLRDEPVDVGHAVRALADRGIIHRNATLAHSEYRFGESLTQEVAYETLLVRQRRQLHERYARLLAESSGNDASAERAALVAHHWERSEVREPAARALLAAAKAAERVPAYPAAADFYVRAWRVAEAGLAEGDVATFRPLVLAATYGTGNLAMFFGLLPVEVSERAAQRGREIAAELGDTESEAVFTYAHGVIRLQEGTADFQAGLALAEEGFALAERGGHQLAAVRIARGLCLNYASDGRFDLARRTIEWVLARLDEMGHAERRSDLYFGSRWARDAAAYAADDLEQARVWMEESHRQACDANNRTVQTALAGTLAHVYLLRAAYDDALHWAKHAFELGDVIGNVAVMPPAVSALIIAQVALRVPFDQADLVERLERGMDLVGPTQTNVRFFGEALLAVGEVDRGLVWIDRLQSRAGGRLREAHVATIAGQVYAAAGRADDAVRRYRDAMEIAGAIGVRSIVAVSSLGMAELCAASGRGDDARAHATRAVTIIDALGLERYRGRATRVLADASPAAAVS